MNEELKIIISAEVDKLKKSLKEANSGVNDFKSQYQKASQDVDKNIQKMGEGIKKSMLVVSGAVVGAAGSLYALTNKTAETADRIDKMSQKIGISKEAFQEWDYVCSQSGVDVGVL